MPPVTSFNFKATIHIIGINPFVFIPETILEQLFLHAEKNKGPIPVKGTVNKLPYRQTLVRYCNEWRLYINTSMLKNSPKRIGETIALSISIDPDSREIPIPPDFLSALKSDKEAERVYNNMSNSLQTEIIRYLAGLKTKESLERNITRAINFLKGKERFIGREKP